MFSDNQKLTLQTNDGYFICLNTSNFTIALSKTPSPTLINVWTVNLIHNTLGFQLTAEGGTSVYYLNGNLAEQTLTAETDSGLTGTHFIFAQDPQSTQGVGLFVALTQNGTNRVLRAAGAQNNITFINYPPLATSSSSLVKFTVA